MRCVTYSTHKYPASKIHRTEMRYIMLSKEQMESNTRESDGIVNVEYAIHSEETDSKNHIRSAEESREEGGFYVLIPKNTELQYPAVQITKEFLSREYGKYLDEDENLKELLNRNCSDENTVREINKIMRDQQVNFMRSLGRKGKITENSIRSFFDLKENIVFMKKKLCCEKVMLSILADVDFLFDRNNGEFLHKTANKELIKAHNKARREKVDPKRYMEYSDEWKQGRENGTFDEEDEKIFIELITAVDNHATQQHQSFQDYVNKHYKQRRYTLQKQPKIKKRQKPKFLMKKSRFFIYLRELLPNNQYHYQTRANVKQKLYFFFHTLLPTVAEQVAENRSHIEDLPFPDPTAGDKAMRLYVYYQCRLKRLTLLYHGFLANQKVDLHMDRSPFTYRGREDKSVDGKLLEAIMKIKIKYLEKTAYSRNTNNTASNLDTESDKRYLSEVVGYALKKSPPKLLPAFLATQIISTETEERLIQSGETRNVKGAENAKERYAQLILFQNILDNLERYTPYKDVIGECKTARKETFIANCREFLNRQILIKSSDEANKWKRILDKYDTSYEDLPEIGFQLFCYDCLDGNSLENDCLAPHFERVDYRGLDSRSRSVYNSLLNEYSRNIRVQAIEFCRKNLSLVCKYQNFRKNIRQYLIKRRKWLDHEIKKGAVFQISVTKQKDKIHKAMSPATQLEIGLIMSANIFARKKLQEACARTFKLDQRIFQQLKDSR